MVNIRRYAETLDMYAVTTAFSAEVIAFVVELVPDVRLTGAVFP